MSQLITCTCERCGNEFTMAADVVEDANELSCPVCERSVTVTEIDDEDEEEEDDELVEPAAGSKNPRRRR